MASQAARQRKGAGVGPPKSGEALMQVSNAIADASMVGTNAPTLASSAAAITATTATTTTGGLQPAPRSPMVIATVKRNKYGTGPFDENWLNVDCCGIVCAIITYLLHLYGVYATCLILIPPWMSTISEDGVRTISFMGQLNRTAFTLIAWLAIYAHFKAMTTDPGAVPPDAQPIPDHHYQGDLESGIVGEQSSHFSNEDDPLRMPPSLPSRKKGKRICRRCNAFKPKRAHHCSICRRCIIKMDRKYKESMPFLYFLRQLYFLGFFSSKLFFVLVWQFLQIIVPG
jgi:ribosomal protein L40E